MYIQKRFSILMLLQNASQTLVIAQQMYAILLSKNQRYCKKCNKKSANDCIIFSVFRMKTDEQNSSVTTE